MQKPRKQFYSWTSSQPKCIHNVFNLMHKVRAIIVHFVYEKCASSQRLMENRQEISIIFKNAIETMIRNGQHLHYLACFKIESCWYCRSIIGKLNKETMVPKRLLKCIIQREAQTNQKNESYAPFLSIPALNQQFMRKKMINLTDESLINFPRGLSSSATNNYNDSK